MFGTRIDKIIIFGNFQKKRVEICISVVKSKLTLFQMKNTICFLTIGMSNNALGGLGFNFVKPAICTAVKSGAREVKI